MINRYFVTLATMAFAIAATAAEPPDEALIRKTQQRLLELEWYPGPVDGKLGPKTRAAIADYQRFAGIEPDGEPYAKWVNMLFIPCQITLGGPRMQPQYGCRKIREVSPGVFEVSIDAPKPSYADREPCHPPPVAQARHTEVPALRFDGFYQESPAGVRTLVRFFPDGMMIQSASWDDSRFIACWFTRKDDATGGRAPQAYVIDGTKLRFEIPDKKGVHKYEGDIREDDIVLTYRQYYTTGGVLIGNTAAYRFYPDAQP